MAGRTGATKKAAATNVNGEVIDTPLNRIIEWPHNPRRTRMASAVEQSAASMKALGQIMPIIILPIEGGELFYAIDGETRRQGANLRADRGEIEPDSSMKTIILPADTSHENLLSIAMAANIVREQMNPIEEMEAFNALANSGIKLSQIADAYNYDLNQVKQRISLGSLVEGARDLVRSGARPLRWAEAMTVGSPAQQERIVAEIAANPSAYADSTSVRAEVTRGNIPASHALFDTALLSKSLVVDLFTPQGGGSFKDHEAFWKLQRQEVQKKIDELGKTHSKVLLFDRERFNDAGWSSGGEPADSTAVVILYDDGSVVIREGMVPPAWAEKVEAEGDVADFLDGADFSDEHERSDDAVERVQVNPLDTATKNTQDYLNAQVVAGLKIAAARDHRVAMAFVVAQTLTRHGGLASSMQINGFGIDTKAQTAGVFDDLKTARAARDGLAKEVGILGVNSPAKIVSALLSEKDEVLNQIFAWAVAESISAPLGPIAVEVYEAVGAEIMQGWTIEQAYLDTLTNAQIRALALEVVEASNQPRVNASIPVVRKAIIDAVEANALQGNWVGPQSQWIPPQVGKVVNEVASRLDAEAAAAAATTPAIAA